MTPEERKFTQLIEVVENLLAESAASRAQLQTLVQERVAAEPIDATGRYDDRTDEGAVSETQGRTLFSYGVMSNLLGRGGVATTRIGVTRQSMCLEIASLLPDNLLPPGASAVWVLAADKDKTQDVSVLTEHSLGLWVANLTNITDDKDIQQVELRNARGLPLALGGALPRLPLQQQAP